MDIPCQIIYKGVEDQTMKRMFVFTMTLMLVSASCSIQKRVTSPQLNLPEKIVEGESQDSLCFADMAWMEVFDDSLLLDLMEKTLEYNKDLLSASARIREFDRRRRIARGGQFPEIGAEAYVDRETTKGYGADAVLEPETAAKLSLSWEIDFFGRLRWANREAVAEYMRTVEAHRALQMTLLAEVATAYFELLALDKEMQIVENTLETRRVNVQQAKLRFEGGITSEIPFRQAQVELAKTASMVPDLRHKIKVKENEISYLAGSYPSSIERQSMNESINMEDILKVGLPSDLIRRRPDVRAAEQEFNAFVAQVGVRWADRFPRFVIGLDGGFEHTGFAGFFSAPLTYMLGKMTSPVFAFGRKKAQYEAALASCEAKCHEYEDKVLQAFHEVSNAVEAYRSSVRNTFLMEALLSSSRKYVDLALFQHLNGQIDYLDVLDAQRSCFNAEIQHSNAIRDQYLAMIDLYKALGGGWK